MLRPADDGGCEIAAYDAKGNLVDAAPVYPRVACQWVIDLTMAIGRRIPLLWNDPPELERIKPLLEPAPTEPRDAGR